MSSPIEAHLLLADAAQVDPSGKVHLLGAGWSVTTSPTAPQAVVAFIRVPWDRTNVPLDVSMELVDDDGRPVLLPGPPEGELAPIMDFRTQLEVGRPAGVAPGTPIGSSFAVNLQPMPLPPGRYSWRLEVAEGRFSASFSVVDI